MNEHEINVADEIERDLQKHEHENPKTNSDGNQFFGRMDDVGEKPLEIEGSKDKAFYLSVGSPNGTQNLVAKIDSFHLKMRSVFRMNQISESWASRFEAFKEIYTLVFVMFMHNMVTLGIFPALVFNVGIGLRYIHAYPLLTVLFNIGDVIGALSFKFSCFRISDGKKFYTFAMIRNISLPLVYICCMFWLDTQYWYCGLLSGFLTFIVGITGGYVYTGCFTLAPGRLPQYKKQASTYSMLLGCVMGLLYGTFVDYMSLLR